MLNMEEECVGALAEAVPSAQRPQFGRAAPLDSLRPTGWPGGNVMIRTIDLRSQPQGFWLYALELPER